MKKILYISYDGLTDPLGQSQILPYLAALTKEGYLFTIISFEKPDRLQKEKEVVQGIVEAAGIEWHPLHFTSKPPVLSKIWDRYRMHQKAQQLHKEKGFDLIHCRSYISAEIGLDLKRRFDVRLIFDMRGFWADEKVDNGQWNQKKWIYKSIYKHYKERENRFLLEADGVVSLTEAAKEHLLEKKEYTGICIDVIPCCADLHHFDYNKVSLIERENIKQELGIDFKSKVITYLGSIGGWYMTKEMFSFFKVLLAQYPEFVMLVLTKDAPERVQEEAKQIGIPADKLVIRYSPRNELPRYLSISDCSIFFIRPTYSKIASSPTKHAELMGMGIPVICNDIGDTGTIIKETGTGLVVEAFTNKDYKNNVYQLNAVLSLSKASVREAAFRYFDLKAGVEKYLSMYRRILNPNLYSLSEHAKKESSSSLSQP